MNLLERLTHWIKFDPFHGTRPDDELRAAIELGRRHKRAERFEEALAALDRADELAAQRGNTTLLALISLTRAEVAIQQNDLDHASALLDHLRLNSTGGQLAYVLCTLGTLDQFQGRIDAARAAYEQARRIAQDDHALAAEGRAEGHLASIYLSEDNASYSIHLLRDALNKLEISGDAEPTSYFVGLMGEAMIASGRETEGHSLLTRALRLAEHMEYVTYERRWRIVLGVQAMAMGHFAEAKRHYKRALLLMDEKRDIGDYVRLLCRLSKACLRLLEHEDALGYARRAVEVAASIPDTDDLVIQAQAVLGVALRAAGQNESAIPLLKEAARHPRRTDRGCEADYSRVDILRNLAAAQAEVSDTTEAIATYERALSESLEAGSPLETAGTRRDIGILRARNDQLQEAINEWSRALDIYETERQDARVARLYCDIANLRRRLGQGRRAMKDFEAALTALNMADDPETRGIVLANAAAAYIDQGDIETAESFLVESIKIAQQLGDRQAEATRRGNYGWFLLSTGRAARALVALDYARRQSEAQGLSLAAAVQTDNIGLAHDELGQHDQALAHHEKALARLQGQNNTFWEMTVRANLGHTLAALNRLDEGAEHLEAALAYGRAGGHYEMALRALMGSAKIAFARQNLPQAGALLEEAVALARRIGVRRPLADALRLQSQYHAAANQHEQAAKTWEEAAGIFKILRISALTAPTWLQKPTKAL